MKRLIAIVIGLLVVSGVLAGGKAKLDPVQKKYKPKLDYLAKKYKQDVDAVKKAMVKDYKRYQSQAMRIKNLKLAMEYENKIKALENKKESEDDEAFGVPTNPNVKFPKGTKRRFGHHYYKFPEKMTYDKAEEECAKLGGHIVYINNEKELKYISDMYGGFGFLRG